MGRWDKRPQRVEPGISLQFSRLFTASIDSAMSFALGALGRFRHEASGGGNGDVGGHGADILDRLRLGLGDLLLGLLGAPLQRLGELGARLMRIGFRFLAGQRDDVLGVLLGLRRASSCISSSSACASSRSFSASASSLAMLAARSSSMARDLRRHLQIDQQRHEEDEGDGDPGFRVVRTCVTSPLRLGDGLRRHPPWSPWRR